MLDQWGGRVRVDGDIRNANAAGRPVIFFVVLWRRRGGPVYEYGLFKAEIHFVGRPRLSTSLPRLSDQCQFFPLRIDRSVVVYIHDRVTRSHHHTTNRSGSRLACSTIFLVLSTHRLQGNLFVFCLLIISNIILCNVYKLYISSFKLLIIIIFKLLTYVQSNTPAGRSFSRFTEAFSF